MNVFLKDNFQVKQSDMRYQLDIVISKCELFFSDTMQIVIGNGTYNA